MEKEQRTRLQKATQDARRLLEEEFRSQLLQAYDIDVDKVRWAEEPGAHLLAEQRLIREKLIAWIEHKEAQINDRNEALLLALREMAFTALNRFVALKLMEARELVRPCVSGGLESAGFLEFTAVAQGLLADQESSYRLYLETIFEDVSRELRALFDPRDPASLLWPKRAALLELLDILNRPELVELWKEDETLGWVYQYFNGDAERKKMREESAAPRNSRELAVRNQFFTPRYVVEFLTDNTLGRIWYEMRQGNTGLKHRCRYLVRRPNEIWLQPGEDAPAEVVADEALSQEELLQQPAPIPHRSLKDPREIRMLDPACGSMHFGLYAFDLYLVIYAEAWEISQGSDEEAKQGEAFAPFVTYVADFATKAAFLAEVPRLILLHNIHGIDIDPRATQIARLTLWLRAQRTWQEQRLDVADRPPITRSNVVCAEPMPGERELLADFVEHQFPEEERGLVQQLLETIFDGMNLAGEAGSLLKIEDDIREVIGRSQSEWLKLSIHQQDLFSTSEFAALGQIGPSLKTDLQNLTTDFWIDIEERIYAALRQYAEQAEDSGGFQRRLFAEDAAQGFAFIDVCRKRYDAAVMNPPFGEAATTTIKYIKKSYPDTFIDVLAAFIERTASMCYGGRVGALTSRACLYTKTLANWRQKEFLQAVESVADLGGGVLDGAMVFACASVFGIPNSRITACEAFDLRRSAAREHELLNYIAKMLDGQVVKGVYLKDRNQLSHISGARFLYNIPDAFWGWSRGSKSLSQSGGSAREGSTTYDNFRFLRLAWETASEDIGWLRNWVFFSKGGYFETFYNDLHLLIKWLDDGREMGEFNRIGYGTDAQSRRASTFYKRPGVTYPRRTAKGFSPRALAADCIFAEKGPVIFPPEASDMCFALGYWNSSPIRALVHLQVQGGSFETGVVNTVPWLKSSGEECIISSLAEEIWRMKAEVYRYWETDRRFVAPLFSSTSSIANLAAQIRAKWADNSAKAVAMCQEISDTVSRAFSLPDIDLEAFDVSPDQHSIQDDFDVSGSNAFAFYLAQFLAGCAFGRWDIRYATGEQAAPELPDPFAPLPVCPPGQLQNAQGFPARPEDVPSSYPILIPWDGILVDDPHHPLDLERRVREVIEIIWSGKEGSGTAESIEHEACEILGVNSLRDYFRKPAGFFADHIKRYSKSRRQAPIYWMLSAGSGSYSAWLYCHRFTQDTIYRVLRNFVEPRIQLAEREQFQLESQGALSGDAATRLKETHTLLQDLRLFKSELDLVAPLWNPNLNDGVIINHAILWRITPHTPWQKKCKECWDKLVKGEYDWAHLALHLWPERVIPKCTTDHSLAIAHGLEERLWQETNNGNWLPRQLSEADLQALIAEHSNPAVKSALERFMAAPPPVAPTRTRAKRAKRSSASGTTRKPRGTATVVDAEASRQTLLALTAAPAEGLSRNAIAELLGVEAASLTAVIKQLKETGQIDQLGERRGARYVLSEQGRARLDQEEAT